MKIGIYGGSFNPVHWGHINVVKYVLEKLELDKILIIPVGTPSHRADDLAPGELRFKMCQVAFENIDKIQVSDIEIKSGKLSFTIDTLKNIREIYGEDNEFYEIIGEDSAYYFDMWKDYLEILNLSKVVVLRRKGYVSHLTHKNLMYLDSPLFNVSSTEIRQRIKNSRDISFLLPEKVEKIMNENNLYKQ